MNYTITIIQYANRIYKLNDILVKMENMKLLFLKSKNEKVLEEILSRIDMNMSNNYKDAAQSAFAEFKSAFAKMKGEGLLKDKKVTYYDSLINEYEEKLHGYTHKDQKPYWE